LFFDGAPVRGEIVNIRDSWQAILARKDYPPAVKKLLGDLWQRAFCYVEPLNSMAA
jgi:redox-regulated HSP33 family molecular chaperone